mgnify:CR=1 FL=1
MEYLKIDGEFPKLANCAVTMGKFDGIHRGHRKLVEKIKERKALGEQAVLFAIDASSNMILTSAERASLLEKLGVEVALTAEQNEKVLNETGICFMFAPVYHSSMKYAAPVRKELGVRTVFNILGPLSNPAAATMQLLGVYDKELAGTMAKVLSNLGVTRGVAVCGEDGLDEITLTGETDVHEIRFGEITSYTITPEQFGLSRCPLADLIGGTPEENAQITMDILTGKETGAKRDVVLMNAGMALYLGIDGISLAEGVEKAKELIESGAALKKYEEFREATKAVAAK